MVFAHRLQAGIEAWTKALDGKAQDDVDMSMDTEAAAAATGGGGGGAHKLGGEPHIRKMLHDIRITNQIMYLHPSIENCRCDILQQLFAWEAVVTSQERIQVGEMLRLFLIFLQMNVQATLACFRFTISCGELLLHDDSC